MGPEWVAQLRKLVSTRIRNGAERIACPTDSAGSCDGPGAAADAACANAGGRRISIASGTMMTALKAAMICNELRQSWPSISQAASGDMVIGAMPMPADTSDTARLRRVSNQPVTQAIIGAKIAAALKPTTAPNDTWNAASDVARLDSARPVASSSEPASTTMRGPTRSQSQPQAMLPSASAAKASVIAVEIPVVDHPVSCAIGRRNTGSENSAP